MKMEVEDIDDDETLCEALKIRFASWREESSCSHIFMSARGLTAISPGDADLVVTLIAQP